MKLTDKEGHASEICPARRPDNFKGRSSAKLAGEPCVKVMDVTQEKRQ